MENELKKKWQETRIGRGDDNKLEEIISGKRRTALQNLALRYKRFSIFSLIMIISCPVLLGLSDILPDTTAKWIVLALMGVYFLTVSIMDNWLYEGVKSIDCVTMPVTEVISKAAYYRAWHLKFVMILIPVALLILGGLAWVATSDRYFLMGMAAGALVGIALGTRQFRKFMADYRDIAPKP